MLSKSEYMMFLKHPCWLWLKKNDKSKLPPVDAALQARFDAGFEFETYAEKLFPGAVKIGFDNYQEYLSLPQRTSKAIEEGAKVIIQGRWESDQITCICDVVEVVEDGVVDLFEIKSSTKPTTVHEHDLAFQAIVLEDSGYTVRNISLIYVNKDFVRDGEITTNDLCTVADITGAVKKRLKDTREDIKRALDILKSKQMPNPSPKYCKLGGLDEWLEVYKGLEGIKRGDGSIYDLYRPSAALIMEFEDRGITALADIPAGIIDDKKRAWQLKAVQEDKVFIEEDKVKKFLGQIEYPIYFLDYETLSSVVPYFDGHRPYQQIPFQYSLHILDKPGGQLKHLEYLHDKNSDPVVPLSASLKENIGKNGSVVVWYADFEKSCNDTMGKIAPEFKDFYKDINERIVDLIIPFSNYYYVDKRFGGSASIKDVLPVLVPELSHKALAISEGGAAQRLWMEAILDGKREAEKEIILKDLWDYCELDTLAMVRIWEFLVNLVGVKLKLEKPTQESLF